MNKDILICGVGGQGTVLASKLAAAAAMRAGETVHTAETIGMAQRGGSVTSHVRIGTEAYAPLIPSAGADVILAFEPAEAVRNLGYLKADGMVIVNCVPVKPVSESLKLASGSAAGGKNSGGDGGYDGSGMLAYLQKKCKNLLVVDAEELCKPFGSSRYFNVAILGAAVGTGKTGLRAADVLAEIDERVKEAYRETNKKAFMAGMQAGGTDAVK